MVTLQDIQKVLANLCSPSQEVREALISLNELLYTAVSGGQSVWLKLHSLGMVKILLGLLRSSSEASVLLQAVRAIAILAHDNEDAKLALGSLDIVDNLVQLLSPRSVSTLPDKNQDIQWHKDWVEVYEQSLIALRKLTCMCLENQQRLAQIGGINLIIELCMDKSFRHNFNHFSYEAKQQLEKLVLGQKLICRVSQALKGDCEQVLSSFPAFSKVSSALVSQYPAFYVDLVTKEELWIANAMVSTGTVWPDHTPFPDCAKWTCVYVTCVENGGHIWCQFCSEKENPRVKAMCDNLRQLEPPSLEAVLPSESSSPTIGDVYAAYCSPPGLSAAGWCRARLLFIQPDGALELLTVDFGSTLTLPQSHLRPLPQSCRGIPPQAIPCKLFSVAPLPASVVILENGAAILRNMAFEKYAFRKEIKTFKGIEALIELVQCPDKAVILQALGALLNLAVSDSLRTELGSRGAIDTMLKLCAEYEDAEILEQCVGCLFNMVLCCHENIALIKSAKGEELLRKLLTRQNPECKTAQCIRGILKNIPATGTQIEMSPSNKFLPKEDSLYKARLRANGERCRAKPILRCVPDEEAVGCGHPDDSGQREEEEELSGDQLEHQQSEHASGSVAIDRVLEYGTKLPHSEEDSAHMHWDVSGMAEVPWNGLRKAVCALANRDGPGVILFGVQRDGTVKGIKMMQRQRDQVCVMMDQLMGTLTPRIKFNEYNISYIPVAYEGREIVADHFVLELEINCHDTVHTISEKVNGHSYNRCYYRNSYTNEKLSFQQLRDVVAEREAESFRTEVLGLQDDVDTLQLRVNADHMTPQGNHVTLQDGHVTLQGE